MILGIGPKDKWEADLEKMSRAALVAVVGELHWKLVIYRGKVERDEMGKLLEQCKRYGRWDNQLARHAKFMADPSKVIEQSIRRQKAALKAARQRKKAAKERVKNGTL